MNINLRVLGYIVKTESQEAVDRLSAQTPGIKPEDKALAREKAVLDAVTGKTVAQRIIPPESEGA